MQSFDDQYLTLLKSLTNDGNETPNRTGINTMSIFGTTMTISLSSFPLLTLKRMFWRGVVEELLWFIRGETNSKTLESKGINIWKTHSNSDYLKTRGLEYEDGELGPIYGYQWRNWGGDQLAKVINTIKTNPTDRRIILSSWNVNDLDKMALPPCHIMCQFYVSNGKLDCQYYQRSVDVVLGMPFNIASYALLTCIIAKTCNLEPGRLLYVGGDTHIYSNHYDAVLELLKRVPFESPTLTIKKELSTIKDIEELTYDDFEITEYKSHQKIKADIVC